MILKKELNYEFRKRMLDVYKKDRRLVFEKQNEAQVEICDGWSVIIPEDADRVIYNAARDIVDYFLVSMGVSVILKKGSVCTDKAINYVIDPTLEEGKYRLLVKENCVFLYGANNRLTCQAGYFAEDLMNFAEGPYLETQDTIHKPLYDVRMTHSGYGLDDFPDAHLSALAHAGFTSIVLFVRDYNKAASRYIDFNDIIYRAAGYGLDTYMYSYLHNEVYPEGEEGQAFYDELYGNIFRKCPGFKGVVLVGESCEFRSKDKNTSMMFHRENLGPDGKKIIDKPNPGWWPCFDYPLLLNMIKASIQKVKPDAELIFWTYNWGKQPEQPRIELIRNIPEGITLQVTFEMFEILEREGVQDKIADYAIHFEGPGKYFISEAKEAKKHNIRLHSMVNTAGATWDMGVIPYVPAPYQWAKRYENMKKYHDECALTGLMESHHFGCYPSFITDFAKWMFHSPDDDINDILKKIATRDFSGETASDVLEAYKLLSDGIRHTVTNNADQYGPYRIGPGYPLTFRKAYTLPSVPWARFGNNSICNPNYAKKYPLDTEQDLKRINHEINYNSIARKCYDQAADILFEAAQKIDETKKEQAFQLATLARFMARCAQTTINTKLWRVARKNKEYAKMIEIAEAEIQNAKATIPLVEFDSRLGWEPTMEYMCDREHIEWKIATTRQVVDEEIRPMLK